VDSVYASLKEPHMRFVRAVIALTTLLLLGAAPVPKQLMKDEPYWPTAVGTKWVYEQGGKESTQEITKVEARDGGTTRLTVRTKNGDDIIDVAPGGVTQRTVSTFTLDTLIVRFPIKAGDSWAFAYPVQAGLHCIGGKMTVGEEEDVKVPAGTFRATKVVCTVTEVRGKPIDKPYTLTHWYAKGVGLVRVEWDGGERVLKAFAPAQK